MTGVIARSLVTGLIVHALVGQAATVSAQPQAAPRTLAFVVGIEHYADPELDKLKFAADDARKVFEQLQVVTDLDPRSVLMVADDEKKSSITGDAVRTALQRFVQLINDRTNVVVYLGGHGTLSDAQSLLYLPSNYSPRDGTGYVAFNEIRDMFVGRIHGRKLFNTSLTFLVNMCGAGNAVAEGRTNLAVDDNRELIDAARKLFRDESFGLQRYAVVPATPKGRNTFEDDMLQSSVFAYHLREGLAGGAARDGVVSTGSLFSFLEGRLREELPRHSDFNADIPLGVTLRLEGLSDYLVGTALLASAQALPDDGVDPERARHRDALLDLAADRLATVPSSAADLSLRAVLRRAQVDVLRKRPPDPDVLKAAMPSGTPADTVEADQLKALGTVAPNPQVASLRSLRDTLQKGAPFYALIIDSDRNSEFSLQSAAGTWHALLASFPGAKKIQSLVVSASDRVPSKMDDQLGLWVAAEKGAPSLPRLIVVYVGLSSVRDSTEPKNLFGKGAQLYPFGKGEVDRVAGAWRGPVTVCYLAAFGGMLLASEAPKHPDMSMLVAAREPNGMTFGRAASRGPEPPVGGSNAGLLALAFADGVEQLESYQPLVELAAEFKSPLSPDWVPGTAAWIPNVGRLTAKPVVDKQTAPLQRFALHVAAGCVAERLETCDAKGGSPDPFETLVLAARADLAKPTDPNVQGYGEAARLIRTAASGTHGGGGARRTREVLNTLADTISQRSAGASRHAARRVVVLRLGVEEYVSPLVPDLPGTRADLGAYGDVLKKTLDGLRVAVEMRDVRLVGTAAEILDSIKAERTGLGADDLLVLIYSGRGAEIDGRRYLTGGAARPCHEVTTGIREMVAKCQSREWTELVDLWDIAELMRDRWLLALYDAQFVAPIAESRFDELLDKHLDSGRRGLPQDRPDADVVSRTPPARRSASFVTRTGSSLPSRQVHIWFEGTLTASANPPLECASKEHAAIASPLAAALVAALPPKTPATYWEWLQQIAQSRCLAESRASGTPRLVVQGALDVPMFATGEAAELVDYFRNDAARRDATLLAGAAVVEDALTAFPTDSNRLSRAAILLALASLHGPADNAGGGYHASALRDAGRLLNDVSMSEADARMDLRALWYELLARRHVLSGDPVQARIQLLHAGAAVLAERGLAERLVTLTAEAARLQPVSLLDETSKYLDEAATTLADSNATKGRDAVSQARSQLMTLMQSEQARRSSDYTIAPPGNER